ncbi:MAG: sugar transferase [Negativicutes bacterium]|nr:sugar transferase [Negativicutes bacterium]
MKRLFDVLFAGAVLLVLWPVLLAVAAAIVADMGRPVFFVQTRPGKDGKPFRLYKFRTMTDGRDENGILLPDEQRITRLGRLIRSLSLDEFLQFVNVLKGDMSVVGPRPLLMEYLPRYSERQHRRHEVRPGITGWAQVNGRNAISWKEKFELDVWYVDNRSFTLDLYIIWLTVKKVLKREGISRGGHATMPYFDGTN